MAASAAKTLLGNGSESLAFRKCVFAALAVAAGIQILFGDCLGGWAVPVCADLLCWPLWLVVVVDASASSLVVAAAVWYGSDRQVREWFDTKLDERPNSPGPSNRKWTTETPAGGPVETLG